MSIRHYYITGVDGVGKTTQVDLLELYLNNKSLYRRVWLRFPIFTSLPLLIYARVCNYTQYKIVDGIKVGSWKFSQSLILRTLFPWTQLIDTYIYSIYKVRWPKFQGRSLIFERYSIDVLVDLMVAIENYDLHTQLIGRLFMKMIPKDTHHIILEAPITTIRGRRSDLLYDPLLKKRAKAYDIIAKHFSFQCLNTGDSINNVSNSIMDEFDL